MRAPRFRTAPLRTARRRAERGFSVVELLVALLIAVEILIAMAVAFDVHNKVSRAQLQITDMQQALRIAQWDMARMVRQLGRGGMRADLAPGAVFDPGVTPPSIQGRALEVRNNVNPTDGNQNIARGDATSPTALEGTDILTVRGCFSTPLFQINSGTFDGDSDGVGGAGDANGRATLTIPPTSVAGVPQPFDEVQAEIADHPGVNGVYGYMLLGSFLTSDDWGVGAITAQSVDGGGNLQLTLQLVDSATLTDFSPINPLVDGTRSFPKDLVATTACLLEEYRYYVRDVREAGDAITPLRPRLTRARFEPGTEIPYQNVASNLTLDLADQVFDLQIALGFDSDYSGSFDQDADLLDADDTIFEADEDGPAPGQTQDDWLYNDPGDNPGCDPTDAGCDTSLIPWLFHDWTNPDDPADTLDGVPAGLYFVRLTTAARTFRPDNTYQAPDLDTRTTGDWLEDHDHDTPPAGDPDLDFNSDSNRKHRRRTLTTVVEMRNL